VLGNASVTVKRAREQPHPARHIECHPHARATTLTPTAQGSRRALRWLVLLAALAAPISAAGAQEVQVPLDEAGRIEAISPELARRLGLFAEIDGLREVLLFQLPDSTFVLEVTSAASHGRVRRDRRPLSAAEGVAFRHDVTTRIAERAHTAGLDQSGRTKLLAGTTILGLGYYGWATAAAIHPNDDRASVAVYMLTAAGSFFVPFLTTRNRTVPDAVATMALWGATRGAVHGALAADLIGSPRARTRFRWSAIVGGTETVIGGVAAQTLGMTSGRAELTGVGGDIGLGVGWGIANLLKLDEHYDSVTAYGAFGGPYTYGERDRTAQQAVTLAGSALGLAGGYLLGGTEEWTRGDAAIFRNVTAIVALAGVAVGDLIQQPRIITETVPGSAPYSYVDDGFSRTHTAAGLAGAAGGMVLGHALVAGRNFTTSQGTLLTLSPLAGGLLGLGIAYLATPERQVAYDPALPYRDPNDHSEIYLTATALGAAAGFAALYPALARQSSRPSASDARLRFSVNPLAPAQMVSGRRARIVLGSVQYRF
jgi:hypothetical protein